MKCRECEETDTYYTPSGRPTPYPNMSDDDLDDFEAWAREVDARVPVEVWLLVGILVVIVISVIVGLWFGDAS